MQKKIPRALATTRSYIVDKTKMIGAVNQEIDDDKTTSKMPIDQELKRTQLVLEKNENFKQLATQTKRAGGTKSKALFT
jgi:predicted DNA-binding protein YlxM (UPF0122 family)